MSGRSKSGYEEAGSYRVAEYELCPDRADVARRTVELDRSEAMRLLASAPFGRIVFTRDALPAIRPVTHLVDDRGFIITRTQLGPGLAASVQGRQSVVVAYQVDDIDPIDRLGWSVVVTGVARTVVDPQVAAGYAALLPSWADLAAEALVAIEPTLVTGLRLVEEHE
ncbi:pyridoxamine 5'-phosphate oxidase family protein [Nocardia sp. NPDC049220]|uniref:pyridoxamine 5'-phosphate oxidase family protein n=1 Tax=Nocardia sp. NPDC049220 TaxID=3155273 RepID=UPI0033FF6328